MGIIFVMCCKGEVKVIKLKKSGYRYPVLKAIAVLLLIFIVLGAISFPLKTVYYDIYSDEVREDVRILQISDLHSTYYGKNMNTLIEAIDEAAPDIIVMTGDVYDDERDNINTSLLIENIGSRYECYYVAGNHEFRTSEWAYVRKAEAENFGVTVLEGDCVSSRGITVCGAARSADGSISLDESLKLCAEGAEGYSVLLYHYPEDIDYLRSYDSFDLILCGHAHGGQWRIPFIANGIYAPGEGLFPKYAGGRYDFDDCTMIVSRGLKRGIFEVPRIFNNPELVVIDIHSKEED